MSHFFGMNIVFGAVHDAIVSLLENDFNNILIN